MNNRSSINSKNIRNWKIKIRKESNNWKNGEFSLKLKKSLRKNMIDCAKSVINIKINALIFNRIN